MCVCVCRHCWALWHNRNIRKRFTLRPHTNVKDRPFVMFGLRMNIFFILFFSWWIFFIFFVVSPARLDGWRYWVIIIHLSVPGLKREGECLCGVYCKTKSYILGRRWVYCLCLGKMACENWGRRLDARPVITVCGTRTYIHYNIQWVLGSIWGGPATRGLAVDDEKMFFFFSATVWHRFSILFRR